MSDFSEDWAAYRSRVLRLVKDRACFPPEGHSFCTAEGLKKKFDENGQYKQFYGDTTVFSISAKDKAALSKMQAELDDCAGFMFAEKLPANSFHITLHDLCAGESADSVAKELGQHKTEIPPLIYFIRSDKKIRLKSVGIVNMMSTSVVLLFEPASESDYETIREMYQVIDEYIPLAYPLTIHCTLAYYRQGIYRPEQWNGLLEKITEMNMREPAEVKLDCMSLEYQQFSSMKEYSSPC